MDWVGFEWILFEQLNAGAVYLYLASLESKHQQPVKFPLLISNCSSLPCLLRKINLHADPAIPKLVNRDMHFILIRILWVLFWVATLDDMTIQ